MKEQLISFETALLIENTDLNSWRYSTHAAYSKEDGKLYNPDVISIQDNIYAPSQSLLQRWLREKHKITVIAYPSFLGATDNYYYLLLNNRDFDNIIQQDTQGNTYEEALEAGLAYALSTVVVQICF